MQLKWQINKSTAWYASMATASELGSSNAESESGGAMQFPLQRAFTVPLLSLCEKLTFN